MLLSIIIPAYNEAKLIGHTLGKLKSALASQQKSNWEIILCDNNSSDNTAAIAREQGIKSLIRLISSTLISVLYLLLFFILPKPLRPKLKAKHFSFWYKVRSTPSN